MFIPGYAPHPYPLSRHLPPLGEGIAAAYGEQYSAPGDIVIDPFGQTPRVALELFRMGRRVIVANNNSVLRLALRAALDPLPNTALRSVLTRLADSRLAAERLETYVRRIYRSTCPDCGNEVEVDAFHWEKEALADKSYHCVACNADKTRPADSDDVELAGRFPAGGPQYHWAMERVAPPDDPDRPLVAEALEAYTPRALSILFALTNKGSTLDLDEPQRRALELLLLMAYDEGVSLEGARPRTLKPHVRFREKNIWFALERLARDPAWQSSGEAEFRLVSMADLVASTAPAVALYEGSIRDLAKALQSRSIPCMIAALPRPNLVLWTLSTAWAGWLWGESSARPMRQLIRRRRYDWAWHESALRSGLTAARALLTRGGRFVALLPESGAGFVSAALTGADGANFTLIRHALRAEPPETQFIFQPDSLKPEASEDLFGEICGVTEEALVAALRERGEPARWPVLSGAIDAALARRHLLRAAVEEVISEPFDFVRKAVETAVLKSKQIVKVQSEEEEGEFVRPTYAWWWLVDPSGAESPLADRVEFEVARALAAAARMELDTVSVEKRVCQAFSSPDVQPDAELIGRCLVSYGEQNNDAWRFRPEDKPLERARDSEKIVGDISTLGRRMKYTVEAGRLERIEWQEPATGAVAYRFFITDSAAIARYVYSPPADRARRVIVIPGGRAGLLDYKLKRDPLLRASVEQGTWLFVKFRHIRRLLDEPDLNPSDLDIILSRDPIVEQSSTQLPLL